MPGAGILILSPDTLLLRLMPLDFEGLLALRGFFNMIVVMVYLMVRYQTKTWQHIQMIGWSGFVAGVLFAVSNYGFVYASQTTTIADLLVILAILPIVTALLSALFLKEYISPALWIASIGCFGGMIILFAGELDSQTLSGNLSALLTTLLMAVAMVILRAKQNYDMTPTYMISGALLFAFTYHDAHLIEQLKIEDGFLYFCYMIVISSFILILLSIKYLSIPEVSLFILLETILGPLWVWLFIGEIPRTQTFVGGSLIILILSCYFSFLLLKKPAN
ncbi:MAG: DMT family transporter [Pseudomonadota bacterium]